MRKLLVILVVVACSLRAQQLTQYTQFTFNKSGYNPAASGSSLKQPVELITGTRRQWTSLTNSPRSNFASFNYTFIPKRSYRRWHNVGAYVEQDNAGVFVNTAYYLSYTVHLRVTKKLIAAFGVYAGARQFGISLSSLDRNDPAVMRSAGSVWAYPDIIPGLRLYNKKVFFDFSIRQLTTPKQAGYSSRQIGTGSKLPPHYYISAGRRIFFDNGFTFIPAVNVHAVYNTIPSVEANLMVNYRSRVSVGATVRNASFVSGILQLRILRNCIIGMAYDYSINKYRVAAPNTIEFMIGITPMFEFENKAPANNVAKCPDLAF